MHTTLTEGKVGGTLIKFTLPFLLASIIQMAYGAVDVVMLSWYASPASLAGAGNGSTLIASLTSVLFGFTNGGMILLGQYFGAKQEGSSAKTVGNIILLQAGIAVLGTALVLSLGQLTITITKVPSEIDEKGLTAVSEAWKYMRVCAAGLIFQAGFNTISSMLRALGDSRTPLIFVSISCVVHIILGLIFIRIFEMGAPGAALATVISQAFSFLISLLYIRRKKLPFRFTRGDVRPDRVILKTIFRLGVPIALQTMLNSLSFLVIATIINNMGLYASSANGLVNSVINFYMIIPFAFGSALSAVSAQNLGAGKPKRALESTKLGVVFSLTVAIPCTLAASFFPTQIISLFSPNENVVKAAAEYLIPFSWDFTLVGFIFCINGFLNGCGITTFVAIHETVAAFAVRIPLSWALSLISGATLFHVGIGTPAASLVSLAMCVLYYRVKLSGGRLEKLKIAGDA